MIINWCVVLRVQCTLGSTSFFALCFLSVEDTKLSTNKQHSLSLPAQVTSVVLFNIGPVTPNRISRCYESNKRLIRFGVCWLFIFKVTEPNSIPYGTHSACAKRAAYPDPPPVIPVPESGVAEVTHLPSPRSLGEPRPNRLSSESGSASGPKCFQVLGLSPSLLQNPML